MVDQKARAWAERLMRGDIRDGDLKGLFLYARDRPDGRDVVTEIGDFSAHYSERNKGILTKGARDWYAIVTFHAAHNFSGNPPIQVDRMPPITPDYFDAMLDRLDDKQLRQKVGMKRSEAYKVLKQFRDKLRPNGDGTHAFSAATELDAKVFQFVCGFIKVQPVFDGDRLAEGVLAILRSAGVLSKEDIKAHPHLRRLFQVYAIAIMHNCRVQMEGIDPIRLHAVRGPNGLSVNAASPVTIHERVVISAPIFVTKLQADECCEPDTLTDADWANDVEVTANGKLGFLG